MINFRFDKSVTTITDDCLSLELVQLFKSRSGVYYSPFVDVRSALEILHGIKSIPYVNIHAFKGAVGKTFYFDNFMKQKKLKFMDLIKLSQSNDIYIRDYVYADKLEKNEDYKNFIKYLKKHNPEYLI